MKNLLMLSVVVGLVVAGCSSEQSPVTKDGATLVVVKHKAASGTSKRQHKKRSTSEVDAQGN